MDWATARATPLRWSATVGPNRTPKDSSAERGSIMTSTAWAWPKPSSAAACVAGVPIEDATSARPATVTARPARLVTLRSRVPTSAAAPLPR